VGFPGCIKPSVIPVSFDQKKMALLVNSVPLISDRNVVGKPAAGYLRQREHSP